jgi:hypothetical protein
MMIVKCWICWDLIMERIRQECGEVNESISVSGCSRGELHVD